MIALFLAVLEMVRMQAVEVTQKDLFGEIRLRRHRNFDAVFADEQPSPQLKKTTLTGMKNWKQTQQRPRRKRSSRRRRTRDPQQPVSMDDLLAAGGGRCAGFARRRELRAVVRRSFMSPRNL